MCFMTVNDPELATPSSERRGRETTHACAFSCLLLISHFHRRKTGTTVKSTMSTATKPETRRRGVAPAASQKGSEEATSGFILKLFEMVNGAPDEVISVRSPKPSISDAPLGRCFGPRSSLSRPCAAFLVIRDLEKPSFGCFRSLFVAMGPDLYYWWHLFFASRGRRSMA